MIAVDISPMRCPSTLEGLFPTSLPKRCEHMPPFAIGFLKIGAPVIMRQTASFQIYKMPFWGFVCELCAHGHLPLLPLDCWSFSLWEGLSVYPFFEASLKNLMTSQIQSTCEILMAPDAHVFQLRPQEKKAPCPR